MDSDQGMYKLRNGSETVKWLADHIEELEGLLAEKLDAYKLGLDTAKRAYQDERDEYEATIKRLTDAFRHTHVNDAGGLQPDRCWQCGLDIRDAIHGKALEDE